MPVSVVAGGQFGSEGKGKVAHYFARELKASIAVRVGGSNSGHTVVDGAGNLLVLRQLPTAAILPNVQCMLTAGSYIDPDILLHEIELTGIDPERVFVDPLATVISSVDIEEEQSGDLRNRVGSTGSGTGAAVKRRISRQSHGCLAREDLRLKPFLHPCVQFMRSRLDAGG